LLSTGHGQAKDSDRQRTSDHHAAVGDVRIAYGEVTFELTRYDVGGKVTDRDVEVAKKISATYRAR
jgi:pterin-4a-carbinolamine dehydratase